MTRDSGKISIALLNQKVDFIKEAVTDIQGKLEKDYATREWVNSEYSQTKKVVNAFIGIILVAVVGAIVGLVIIK